MTGYHYLPHPGGLIRVIDATDAAAPEALTTPDYLDARADALDRAARYGHPDPADDGRWSSAELEATAAELRRVAEVARNMRMM